MKKMALRVMVLLASVLVGCMHGNGNRPIQEHRGLGVLWDKSFDATSVGTADAHELHERITRLRFNEVMKKGLSPEESKELTLVREELLKRNSSWSNDVKAAVRKGIVIKGMNPDQVRAAFGEPTAKIHADENTVVRPDSTAYVKNYWKGRVADTWVWQGDTTGYVAGNVRHYERYSYGSVLLENGVVTQSSLTK